MTPRPILILILLAASPPFSDGEVAESCYGEPLRLKCSDGGEDDDGPKVVMREAWLYGQQVIRKVDHWSQGVQCTVPEYNRQYKAGTFLKYINKQCGGKAECTFSVKEHVPVLQRDNLVLEGGAMRAVYDCVAKAEFHRVCGSEVRSQEGWVQSVGYPLYYLGDPPVCTITLRADEGQRIQLTITDLSLKDLMQPGDIECRDNVRVSEGTKDLEVRCGETRTPITVTSQGNALNITLTASSNVFPKRGYVAYFKVLGCETPAVPADGYLSYRNATHAEFWCCVHHVFPDTLTRRRVLHCGARDQAWNDTLPDCINLEALLENGNITMDEYRMMVNGSTGQVQAEKYRQAHLVYDLVVPTVIMTVLVLGNAAVVFLIIYCRRGIMDDGVQCEELESIKANPEPPDTLDTEPCNV